MSIGQCNVCPYNEIFYACRSTLHSLASKKPLDHESPHCNICFLSTPEKKIRITSVDKKTSACKLKSLNSNQINSIILL